jgi:ubiquinone/menaquinone biosynthesis C-methylase UbiE
VPDDSVLITAKTALEIGGPSEIFSTVFRVYDKIEHLDIVDFSDSSIWHPKSRSVIVSEATDLKVDGPYDLVMASHVLEHIANPLKAVLEWKRVSPGGHIVIVTPVKERTFDHNREATPFDHLWKITTKTPAKTTSRIFRKFSNFTI